MLTQTGFVTDAILAVNTVRQWNSYYKWLQFSKLVAAKTMLRVVPPLFKGFQTILLMESWYMRCTLISYAMDRGLQETRSRKSRPI